VGLFWFSMGLGGVKGQDGSDEELPSSKDYPPK
jgi:hypothetical protein